MNQDLSPIVELHPNVKSALINPQKAMELRGWLKSNQMVAKQWRGEDGETMMHWAFLSSWVLALELQQAGLDFDATDRLGRAPMDWINDRLWYGVVESNTSTQLSAGGKERLRKQTEEQIEYLWAHGARPSFASNFVHPGVVWMRAGAWKLLAMLENDAQYSLSSWAPRGGHALHSWVLSPNTPQRRNFLKQWTEKYDIDLGDHDNRSALWYAIDGWLARKEWQRDLAIVIKELVAAGANPEQQDDHGVSPVGLLQDAAEKGLEERKKIEDLLVLLTVRPMHFNEDEQPSENQEEQDELLLKMLGEDGKYDPIENIGKD